VSTSTTNFTEKERREFRKTHSFHDCLDIVRYPAGWSKDELELANTILTENGILYSEAELQELKRKEAITEECQEKKFERNTNQLFKKLCLGGLAISLSIIALIAIFTFILNK
jgi:hypothetical protein